MIATTDPVPLLSITLDQTGAIMAGIRPDQVHLPTHRAVPGMTVS